MAKIQIRKAEVIQMIKEEYTKYLTGVKLKNRLHQINEEMQQIASEGELDEVKAGGESAVRSTAWTGEPGGDKKYKPEFQKKGSHLVEEEGLEDEKDDIVIDEIPGEEAPEEFGDDETLEGNMDIEAILAKLADAIEDKIETTVDEKVGGGEGEEMTDEIPSEEMPTDVPEEEMDEMQATPEEEGIVKEQDGTSIAQDQKPKNAVPFDNGKAEIPGADQLVSEGVKKRMQILSGIRRNDFND